MCTIMLLLKSYKNADVTFWDQDLLGSDVWQIVEL